MKLLKFDVLLHCIVFCLVLWLAFTYY